MYLELLRDERLSDNEHSLGVLTHLIIRQFLMRQRRHTLVLINPPWVSGTSSHNARFWYVFTQLVMAFSHIGEAVRKR